MNENHKLGNEAYKTNEISIALKHYTLALSEIPPSNDAYVHVCSNICLCYLKLENLEQAYLYASMTIQHNEKWVKGYFRLMSVYKKQGHMEKVVNTIIKIKVTDDIVLTEEQRGTLADFLLQNKITVVRDVRGLERSLRVAKTNVRAHIIILDDLKIAGDTVGQTKVENVVSHKDICLYGVYKKLTKITNVGFTFVESKVLLKNLHLENRNLNLSVVVCGGEVRLRNVTVQAKWIGVKVSGSYPCSVNAQNCVFKKSNRGISIDADAPATVVLKSCQFNNLRTCVMSNGCGTLKATKCKMEMARNGIYVLGSEKSDDKYYTRVKRCVLFDMVDQGLFCCNSRMQIRNCDLYSLRVGLLIDRGCVVECLKTTFSKIRRDAIINTKDSVATIRGCQFTQCDFSALHVVHAATRTTFRENDVFNNNKEFFFPVFIRFNRQGDTDIQNNHFYKNSRNYVVYTPDSRKPLIAGQKNDAKKATASKERIAKWSEYPEKYVENRCQYCLKLEGGDKDKDDQESNLLLCSKCHRTHYCSKKCQVDGWKFHKLECSKLY